MDKERIAEDDGSIRSLNEGTPFARTRKSGSLLSRLMRSIESLEYLVEV